MMAEVRRRGVMYHQPRKELDEEIALLLGLHVGDGWLSINGAFHVKRKIGL